MNKVLTDDMIEQCVEMASGASDAIEKAVNDLIDDGVAPAMISEALILVLGTLMSEAPRHMAAAIDEAVLAKIRMARQQAWELLDAPAPAH